MGVLALCAGGSVCCYCWWFSARRQCPSQMQLAALNGCTLHAGAGRAIQDTPVEKGAETVRQSRVEEALERGERSGLLLKRLQGERSLTLCSARQQYCQRPPCVDLPRNATSRWLLPDKRRGRRETDREMASRNEKKRIKKERRSCALRRVSLERWRNRQ